MRPGDTERGKNLEKAIADYSINFRSLPGVTARDYRETLVEQIVESLRRIEFLQAIQNRKISPERENPTSAVFDPLRAAILKARQGNIDEAFWLIFLATHFGRHRHYGWRLVQDVYGGYPDGQIWTWHRTSSDPNAFRSWWTTAATIFQSDGIPRKFGNHRKYESLRANAVRPTPQIVQDYIVWVGANRGHANLLLEVSQKNNCGAEAMFDALYKSMSSVLSFGRAGRFDFLTMLGNLNLAPIRPGSPYLLGATGPLSGARMLFGNQKLSVDQLDAEVVHLGQYLGVSMQVMEDALCNWQKSPSRFIAFRG
ncbi:hypothetical protein [Limibacillus sp. MBR-115]|jgi:hypothetical protein|uniref:alpha-glutamyl/putrescinyl thymine pyrophosphorylase clade 3 protein n=1 Tax=Limibacillus sp. MBR-115 TaxID=3156465 RepID=UPI003394F13D